MIYLVCPDCGLCIGFDEMPSLAPICHRPMRKVHGITRDAWRALEAEYGEPVRDIIEGMRRQGATWATIAGAVGVNQTTLTKWRRTLGLAITPDVHVWDDLSFEKRRSDHASATL